MSVRLMCNLREARSLFDNDAGVRNSDMDRVLCAEIEYLRALSLSKNLVLATSNRGAYEALLHIIQAGKIGIPVYEAISRVGSAPSSQSGILLRLKSMRAAGIIDEVAGPKRSNVNLIASDGIIEALTPHLFNRSAILDSFSMK